MTLNVLLYSHIPYLTLRMNQNHRPPSNYSYEEYTTLQLIILIHALPILKRHVITRITLAQNPIHSVPRLTDRTERRVIKRKIQTRRGKGDDRSVDGEVWGTLGLFVGELIETLGGLFSFCREGRDDGRESVGEYLLRVGRGEGGEMEDALRRFGLAYIPHDSEEEIMGIG